MDGDIFQAIVVWRDNRREYDETVQDVYIGTDREKAMNALTCAYSPQTHHMVDEYRLRTWRNGRIVASEALNERLVRWD